MILNSCHVRRDEEALDYHEGVWNLRTLKNKAGLFAIFMYVDEIRAFLLNLPNKDVVELLSLNVYNLCLHVFFRTLQQLLRVEHLIKILLYSIEEFNLDDSDFLIKEVAKIEHESVRAIPSAVNPT